MHGFFTEKTFYPCTCTCTTPTWHHTYSNTIFMYIQFVHTHTHTHVPAYAHTHIQHALSTNNQVTLTTKLSDHSLSIIILFFQVKYVDTLEIKENTNHHKFFRNSQVVSFIQAQCMNASAVTKIDDKAIFLLY